MAKLSRTSVNLDVEAGTSPSVATPDSDTPFRILLMGDFSGRANRRAAAPAKWKPVRVDRDNFDQVLAGAGAELRLGQGGAGIVLRFRELEDFHPDRIYEQSACFEKLRQTRRKLVDPVTFAEAARALRTVPPAKARETSPPAAPRVSSGSLLDDIVEEAEPGERDGASRKTDELRAFIDKAVAPHLAPRQDPELPELIAQVDGTAGKLMGAILHQPDFQALEAAWRAVFLLVRGLETDEQLKLYLLDISKAELPGAMASLRGVLAEDIPGAEPWAVVAGNYTFQQTPGDTALLAELAKTMRASGAPFLAEGDPAGESASPESSRAWESLRRSADAAWLGLAMPRFLLRLPYGEKTDPVEHFAFEEMSADPEHAAYLWGNPAFACAYLLGQAFTRSGWDMRPGEVAEIGGLPLHVYQADGEEQIKPCAEMWMTERDADWIMEQGLMVLASMKNQDTVRLLRFQSIADPLARLAGRWG